MANFRLFATNGNGKRKVVFPFFLGWLKINGNRQMLFQQTRPSMIVPRSYYCEAKADDAADRIRQ
jgi:hypothetical protein